MLWNWKPTPNEDISKKKECRNDLRWCSINWQKIVDYLKSDSDHEDSCKNFLAASFNES